MQYPQTAYNDSLQSGITAVALEMTVTTAAPTRTEGILTIGRVEGNREDVFFDGLAGNVITLTLRGLSQTALTPTEVAGNKKVHVANEGVEMTTHHNYATNFARLDEDNTFSANNTFSNAPRTPGLKDSSGNETIDTPATASAVNQLKVTNSATTDPVLLGVAGDDTDIDLELQAKGAGIVIVPDGAQTKTDAPPVNDKDLVNKKYVDDSASFTPAQFQTGAAIYGASSTGNDTYVVTLTPAITGYTDGMTLRIKPDTANTGAATLNVDGQGAVAIQKGVLGAFTALETNDIAANGIFEVTYNSTGPIWELKNPASAMSAVAASTVSGGSSSNADTYHTHSFVKKIVNVRTPVTATAATETTLLSTTVAGGTLGTSGSLDVQLNISDCDIGNGATLTLRFKYGGTTFITQTGVNSTGADIADMGGVIIFRLYADNSTGNQTAFASTKMAEKDIITGPAVNANIDQLSLVDSVGSTAVDSTTNQTLEITAQWSSAAGTQTITMHSATVISIP